MRYFVLLIAYLVMMMHTIVPHHHHDVSENILQASEDSKHLHNHEHEHNHHHAVKKDNKAGNDHEKSELPFSHHLSPIEGSIYLGNQSCVCIEKNIEFDVTAIIAYINFSSESKYLSEKFTLTTGQRLSSDPPHSACGLRAPPIS